MVSDASPAPHGTALTWLHATLGLTALSPFSSSLPSTLLAMQSLRMPPHSCQIVFNLVFHSVLYQAYWQPHLYQDHQAPQVYNNSDSQFGVLARLAKLGKSHVDQQNQWLRKQVTKLTSARDMQIHRRLTHHCDTHMVSSCVGSQAVYASDICI